MYIDLEAWEQIAMWTYHEDALFFFISAWDDATAFWNPLQMSDPCGATLVWVFSSHGVAPFESAAKITEGMATGGEVKQKCLSGRNWAAACNTEMQSGRK